MYHMGYNGNIKLFWECLKNVPRTKIFISSVNQDGLKSLRRNAFRQLTALGHEPLMWEENLGPWPAHSDPITQCLEAVEDCDVYLLFLGNKAGTYDPIAQRTVTHMEFIKAHEQGKTILVFGDVELKSLFFGKVKWVIEQFVEQSIVKQERFPSPLHIMNTLSANSEIPSHVDPYVWYFLYDMLIRKVYIDDISLGVPIDWGAYFSDLLRRGTLLLPLEPFIEDNSLRLEQFDEAFDTLSALIPELDINNFKDANRFLEILISRLQGGIIEQSYGSYLSEKVGFYEDCSGATLYRFEASQLYMVATSGNAHGPDTYELDNQGSYAVLTYNMGDQEEQVFYTESKAMFYYCIRMGKYVLTLHFPCDPDWDYRKFIHYKEHANHAILSKNPLIIQFIKLFLGGVTS
ncbi:hypothetical protein D3C77_363130 [compost metagenome]